ncbi:MAG: HupE/UreJ family protein [Ramlibacter sp.]|nr:HupE/UreJ family protein [Ramlibacter sp.]
MTLAEMTLREVEPGQFIWSWGAPGRSRPVAEDLTPVWPQGCAGDERTVRCSDKGMVGTLSVEGVGSSYSAAIVRIIWRGGESRVYTLTKGQPSVRLFGAARDDRGILDVAQAYAVLGVEHILSGWDHLLFVLSLLLLVGFRRQLVATITAFTIAHSLTLAASALGALSLRPAPVEAVIALSIVLVSAEALNRRETLTRRWPAIVAFVFGLVHGLGFAGALREIGLPEQHVNAALLAFNVGVEAGQLLVIALAWLVVIARRRWSVAAPVRRPILYGIGSLSVYWTFSRLAAMVA